MIDITVRVNNQGLSHRLCILFDAQMSTKFNYADQQFGSIQRPNGYEKEMDLYLQSANQKGDKVCKPLEPANWQQSAIELARTTNINRTNSKLCCINTR